MYQMHNLPPKIYIIYVPNRINSILTYINPDLSDMNFPTIYINSTNRKMIYI